MTFRMGGLDIRLAGRVFFGRPAVSESFRGHTMRKSLRAKRGVERRGGHARLETEEF